VLETNKELDALLAAQTATSTADWLQKTASFASPAQNGVIADRNGSIAIRSTGRFPLRPNGARAWEIQEGTSRSRDWQGDWPLNRYPQATNPARGFLSSANQQPLDPRTDPTYLGVDWTAPWRAMRINSLLREDSMMTVEKMRAMQSDVGSARADFFVPCFLNAARESPELSGGGDSLLRQASDLLSAWNRRYEPGAKGAALFEYAMGRLTSLTWDELEGPDGRRVMTPNEVILGQLLQDPTSEWWDRHSTADRKETRDVLVRQSLIEAFALASRVHGPPDGDGWRWDHVQHANIYHLLRLPALSALGLSPPGSRGTISPISISGTNGSSWRMVIELGPDVRGWGTYPGGQSGNPVSDRYRDRLPKWTAGELDTLRAPHKPEELPAISSRLSLTGAGTK
jgi:penicillin amidase